MFEGTSSARGRSTWNRGASATYDKGVAGRLVALGTTLLDTTGSSCGSTVCIDQHPGFSVSKKVNVIDFTIAGVGVTANLVMSGSIGMDIVATGAASTTNLFVSAARVVPSADFSAGCELSVGLLPFGLADLKFSEKLQVAKAQGGPKVANRLFHHSSTDVDVGWQNEATETLSTGAGKIEAQACSVLLGCGFKTTLATWDAFASTTKTYWTESGSLDDQKAW
jgi:hypothetical protein